MLACCSFSSLANNDEVDENKKTALMRACESGDLDSVKRLVAEEANLTLKCKQGLTALHHAALHGHSAVIEFLVKKAKVDVNITGPKLLLPLHLAVNKAHIEAIRLLLALGGNAEKKARITFMGDKEQTAYNFSALDVALKKKNRELLAVLLTSNKNLLLKAIGRCITHGWTEYWFPALIEDLQESFPDWRAKVFAKGKFKIVKYLIDNNHMNLDLAWKDQEGNTLLHYAAIQGEKELISYLLQEKNQLRINARNSNEYTALHTAVYNKNIPAIEELIEGGALINSRRSNNLSPLNLAHYMRRNEYEDLSKRLANESIISIFTKFLAHKRGTISPQGSPLRNSHNAI